MANTIGRRASSEENASHRMSCSKTAMLPAVKSTISADPKANVKRKIGGTMETRTFRIRIQRPTVAQNASIFAASQISLVAATLKCANGANTAAVSGGYTKCK